MNWLNQSVTKRIYILTSLIMGIITALLIIYNGYRTMELKRHEYEQDLYVVSGLLGNRLSASFDDILASKGAMDKPAEDQVLVLNSVLQPIIEDVLKEYPDMGMGFYSIKLDHNLAVEPNFSPEKLIPMSHDLPYFQVYDTGRPVLAKTSTSIAWESPILNYSSPIFDKNGQIIGHSWVNISLHKMYIDLFFDVVGIFILGVIQLVLVLFILRKMSLKLSNEIINYSTALVNEDTRNETENNLFPELHPIFTNLQKHIANIKLMQEEKIEQLTHSIKLEKSLRASEERFSKIFHASPHMMAIISRSDHQYLLVNERFLCVRGLRLEEVIGKYPAETGFPTKTFHRLMELVDKCGYIENFETEVLLKNKEVKTMIFSAELIELNGEACILFASNDITELKLMQSEMARLDRLNLIGQMAAGIGHEIRNPMTTVRGYIQLLGAKPEYAAQSSTFELMISELDRANSIITEFLSLTKDKPVERTYKSLNTQLNHLYPLLEADAFTQNRQIVFIPGETPDIYFDANELSQLVLNLCRNGLEAMEDEGCLTLKTYTEGSRVVLSVQDEGCGISPEDVANLGTPFFTTKESGTGLGLAICYNIIARHNALVEVQTGSNGTTFLVKFNINEENKERFCLTA